MSLSPEGSLPPLDDVDAGPESPDELLGSQSRRWLAALLAGDESTDDVDAPPVGRDGLFVDRHFPLGELEMQSRVKWKRPKVNKRSQLKNLKTPNSIK